MKILNEVNPPLNTLEHYGTKGMRWGQRKTDPTTSDIHGARTRQANRADAFRKSPNSEKRRSDFETNEDRVTAMHMTNGEKVAAAILAGPVGLIIIGANKGQVKRAARNTDAARRARS